MRYSDYALIIKKKLHFTLTVSNFYRNIKAIFWQYLYASVVEIKRVFRSAFHLNTYTYTIIHVRNNKETRIEKYKK